MDRKIGVIMIQFTDKVAPAVHLRYLDQNRVLEKVVAGKVKGIVPW
jgi:hypothetical protein